MVLQTKYIKIFLFMFSIIGFTQNNSIETKEIYQLKLNSKCLKFNNKNIKINKNNFFKIKINGEKTLFLYKFDEDENNIYFLSSEIYLNIDSYISNFSNKILFVSKDTQNMILFELIDDDIININLSSNTLSVNMNKKITFLNQIAFYNYKNKTKCLLNIINLKVIGIDECINNIPELTIYDLLKFNFSEKKLKQ